MSLPLLSCRGDKLRCVAQIGWCRIKESRQAMDVRVLGFNGGRLWIQSVGVECLMGWGTNTLLVQQLRVFDSSGRMAKHSTISLQHRI